MHIIFTKRSWKQRKKAKAHKNTLLVAEQPTNNLAQIISQRESKSKDASQWCQHYASARWSLGHTERENHFNNNNNKKIYEGRLAFAQRATQTVTTQAGKEPLSCIRNNTVQHQVDIDWYDSICIVIPQKGKKGVPKHTLGVYWDTDLSLRHD